MRTFTDFEVLKRAERIHGFRGFPKEYWLMGIQNKDDHYNEFDDKFFVYYKTTFIMSLTGTTNAGASALMNYKRFNPLGTAIIKTNEWYHDLWTPGFHKGKMRCLKQASAILHYRDNNKNRKAEQSGKLYYKNIAAEFHTATYTTERNFIRKLIGGWSAGCQVANNVDQYYQALNLFWSQSRTTYCLMDEFDELWKM